MSADRYKWRPDGNYLIKCVCSECGEEWITHALAAADVLGRCCACRQVDEWMESERKSKDKD